jgi:hypothetical protein
MFLPLLGERVGVRGKEANSNSRRTTLPELSNFASPPAEPGISQFDYDNYIERLE